MLDWWTNSYYGDDGDASDYWKRKNKEDMSFKETKLERLESRENKEDMGFKNIEKKGAKLAIYAKKKLLVKWVDFFFKFWEMDRFERESVKVFFT